MKMIIKASEKLQNVHYEIRGEVVERAAEMERAGSKIIRLNIGNLAPYGFDAPDEVINDMILNLRSAQGYSDTKGIFSARKAIMQYYQLMNVPNLDIEDIFLGNGVSELIIMCMQALLNPGDEVLVPAPDYPLWTAAVNLGGGAPVHYICDEQAEWYPDLDDIRKKITPNTKAIVIINPNNPTGAYYPREVLEQIVEIARQNRLIIFSDEIYDHLLMDGLKPLSIASMAPDLLVATLNGLSKSHRITGFRAGWVVFSGNRKIARDYIAGVNKLACMRLCPNVPAQYIIQTSIAGYQSVSELVTPGGRIYEQREYIHAALNSIPGVSCVKPKAAFYAFPRLDTERFGITSDIRFALDLLEREKMLVVHGSGFNWPQPDHFRLVYLPDVSTLKEVTRRLERFLSGYKQEP